MVGFGAKLSGWKEIDDTCKNKTCFDATHNVNKNLKPNLSQIRVLKKIICNNQIAPLGDPISITVAGYNLSLRLDEADNIFVEEIKKS